MRDPFQDVQARDPAAAIEAARSLLDESTDNAVRAFAHRALAVARRDSGDAEGALKHLREALRHAREGGDPQTIADVMATNGGTLIVLGRTSAGLRELNAAVERAEGELLATTLYRRGVCRSLLGDVAGAADDAERAIGLLDGGSSNEWLRRALHLLGDSELLLGRVDSAAERFRECLALLDDGAGYEAIRIGADLAWLDFVRGDLPGALERLSRYELSSISDGRLRAGLATKSATVHIAGGLPEAAVELLNASEFETMPVSSAARCKVQLATALLAVGRPEDAIDIARPAQSDFAAMGLRAEAAEAALTEAVALVALGRTDEISDASWDAPMTLTETGSSRAAEAWLVLGRLAGDPRSAGMLEKCAGLRSDPNAAVRAVGWLARAHLVEAKGASGVLRASGRGLDALDDYREIMASSELRAALTHRGRELANLALRHSIDDPRSLLMWSERWRATALAQPSVRPSGAVSPAVAMLRDLTRRIAEARDGGKPTDALEKERRSLERKVRAEHHQQRAEGRTERKRLSTAELVAHVGDGAFVELVDVGGVLHVLVVSKGRVRRVMAGSPKDAIELGEAGRFALRRAAKTGRINTGDLGGRLQETLLGKAVRMLPDGPITISPTAALHGVPFGLMPVLAERPFSVVPSAAHWLRASSVATPRTKRRALVSGPNLLTGGAEVGALAERYPDATVLRDDSATVGATMKAIDGARVAHLATHGTFRADSPLFSALEMADGPLSVYELERLKRAPYRTILSACDSGVLAPVGAQEVLGLASALFSLGSAGLVCSIAEVNDEATAEMMLGLHQALDKGRTPADALAEARRATDPVERATAAAFMALGV